MFRLCTMFASLCAACDTCLCATPNLHGAQPVGTEHLAGLGATTLQLPCILPILIQLKPEPVAYSTHALRQQSSFLGKR